MFPKCFFAQISYVFVNQGPDNLVGWIEQGDDLSDVPNRWDHVFVSELDEWGENRVSQLMADFRSIPLN